MILGGNDDEGMASTLEQLPFWAPSELKAFSSRFFETVVFPSLKAFPSPHFPCGGKN